MICPFMTYQSIDSVKVECFKEKCALWIHRFSMCALAVDAYLKGVEDVRLEHEMLRKER